MPLPPAPSLPVSDADRRQLSEIAGHRSTPQSVVLRIRIVLGASRGISNHQLARELETSVPTVLLWRERFAAVGVAGLLEDQPRSGRPKTLTAKREQQLVEATMNTKPKDATHWSVRSFAQVHGVSPSSVQRIWKKYKLQPHRVEKFKFSQDPEFVPKVRDVVGLYLNPPVKAIVLSVDEKSQIQALDRTQPILPLRPGLPERQTHDYERHGTTTLFAALNVLDGTVIGECLPRHRHQEFLQFLAKVDASVAPDLDVHLILDNYATHKHPAVKAWFAVRPRYHLHFTPTSSSWLNQVERWFAEITRKRIRRGTFRSVKDLVRAIEHYIRENNKKPRPFHWVASASRILQKVKKLQGR